MKKRKQKTRSYSITMPADLKRELQTKALETGRSASGYLSWLIRQDCLKRGLIKE